jgi:tRNA pseudouridine38-40 synthase
MSFVRLDLAYDGTGFAGWATQPGERTVQEDLEDAMEQVLGERITTTVAGRTDAGVHAWGQVASFELPGREPPEALHTALNALTGRDVAMLAAKAVPDGFDARRDARSRTYCFRLYCSPQPSPFERGRSLFWPHRTQLEMLERCAEAVRGVHDFSAFTPTKTRHIRFERDVLRAEWVRGRSYAPALPPETGVAELFELWIEANSFLRGMIRALVGTMLEVATGRRELDDFTSLLEGGPREEAGDSARGHGLYLASVAY